MKLPIEDKPEELLEYGRAHAYLNQVDYLLGTLIDYNKRRQKGFQHTCKGQTLGQKIKTNNQWIPKALLADLEDLNEKRRELSHHGFIFSLDPESNSMRPATIKERPNMIKIDNIYLKDLDEIVKLSTKLIETFLKKLKK